MFCELLRAHCGLHFDEASRFLVEKRVGRRIRELDLGSFAAYHYALRCAGGDEEVAHLVDILTTNETYFFRECGQLAALVEEVIPELLPQRRASGSSRPVSIWSAGCSSGEEPYTIVMMAMEAGIDVSRDLRIYASDISPSMLNKGRRAQYRESAFRNTETFLRDKYFTPKNGVYRISEDVKKCVDFIRLNLLDESKISLLGTMDVVLCRNVIIYFNAQTKKEVIETFWDRLSPGGYLLLGHSESLINISSAFELRHLTNDLVYRRPLKGEEVGDPWHQVAAAAVLTVDGEEYS
jgi:chemotaxis protein methyltransferase CheR